ncbi:hypothetical protein BT93_L4836 [Corymbia citriodora subsp. variegata]|uniref:Replication termination factor 2 n=1 Tax=Corymbia citriodora subsp. variegata TaxID=360336 RepID=A0A8T0CFH8_CORYI|nr:hypothetical protein BT93_L4836 [Corymbia citriodora subsp. variegata]
MGNDGGSIPKRRELVKEAARNPTTAEIKESQQEQQEYYWTTDPISRKPLSPPIVSDSSGKLFNKDTILEYLLPSPDDESTPLKTDAESILQGSVKSLKDIVTLTFDTDASGAFKCPITSDRLGPGSKAIYLVPCGHVFSGAAVKEVSGERCLTCNEVYASNDIIPILPTAATDIARLSLRVKTLKEKGLAHSLKKSSKESKKRKKRGDDEEAPALVPNATNTLSKSEKTNSAATPDLEKTNGHSGIKNTSTASLTARVMAESAASKKRRLENENLKSLFSSRDQSKPSGRSGDFMTRGFDIPAGAKR